MHQRSYSCFNLFLDHRFLQWKIVRLVWIGYYKNRGSTSCLISNLPKDIVQYILLFAAYSVYPQKYDVIYSCKDEKFVKFMFPIVRRNTNERKNSNIELVYAACAIITTILMAYYFVMLS